MYKNINHSSKSSETTFTLQRIRIAEMKEKQFVKERKNSAA